MKRQACAWLLIAFAALATGRDRAAISGSGRCARRDRAHCGRPAHGNLLMIALPRLIVTSL